MWIWCIVSREDYMTDVDARCNLASDIIPNVLIRLHLLANRVYFSKFYSALYVIMIVANIMMIFWVRLGSFSSSSPASSLAHTRVMLCDQMLSMPGGFDGSFAFLFLQIVVNLALVFEVVIRLMSQREVGVMKPDLCVLR